MVQYLHKRLHQHGGSKALDLPASFVKKLHSDYVKIVDKGDYLIVKSEDKLSAMESDPLFALFIESIMKHALANPSKLKDLNEVWDAEWDELLEGVSIDDE